MSPEAEHAHRTRGHQVGALADRWDGYRFTLEDGRFVAWRCVGRGEVVAATASTASEMTEKLEVYHPVHHPVAQDA